MAVLVRSLQFSVLFLVGFLQFAYADGIQLYEQEIKAGLLYNFLKYTDWPPIKMEGTSITVCIFGNDPFDGYLQPMAGRSVNQKEIALRNIHAIAEADTCHLIFINAAEKERWPELRKFLTKKNILTVSDFTGFSGSGGMIEFGHKNDHISASLNMNALTEAQLHVQDRLLKLVTVIRETP